jgi:hypothetical protein
MKMLGGYLEHAINFERGRSRRSSTKGPVEQQAKAYRKLAAQRAAQYGLPPPSEPNENPKQ